MAWAKRNLKVNIKHSAPVVEEISIVPQILNVIAKSTTPNLKPFVKDWIDDSKSQRCSQTLLLLFGVFLEVYLFNVECDEEAIQN